LFATREIIIVILYFLVFIYSFLLESKFIFGLRY